MTRWSRCPRAGETNPQTPIIAKPLPSPVGHFLLGLTVANIVLKVRLYQSLAWLGFVLLAAIAPDFDFIAGWLAGDINRFHHGISHSLGMALMFAAASAGIAALFTPQAKAVFWVGLFAYLSHLLGDYLGVDLVDPLGAQFLWPISQDYYLAPWPIFQPVEHGDAGEHSASVFRKIASMQNVITAMVELVIVLPIWLITLWWARRN